jgi:hypothetical protein
MRKIIVLSLVVFLLSSCDIWGIPSQPLPAQPIAPSNTPAIVTPTPLIIPPPVLDFTLTPSAATFTQSAPFLTDTPPLTPTFTLDPPSPTIAAPTIQSVTVDILGCDTGFDIQNGMFEVTNAYVIVKNNGTLELPNTCALLRAIDEGREHPDKKVCVGTLPVQNQVTLKLTVDSTYKENTIIQVDVTTNAAILLRVDKASCRDIKVFGGVPADLGIIKPIP